MLIPGVISSMSLRAPGPPSLGFADVVLLAPFDGENAATSAPDESNSGHTLTFQGNAALTTSNPKFGSAALNLPGVSDRVNIADHSDFDFGDGPFTLEFWMRVPSLVSAIRSPICKATLSATSWDLTTNSDGGTISFIWRPNQFTDESLGGSAAIVADTWHHVAVDRNAAGTFRLYFDGGLVDSMISAAAIDATAAPVTIGAGRDDGSFRGFVGAIDDLRIVKGFAVYNTDAGFIPPEQAFPTE